MRCVHHHHTATVIRVVLGIGGQIVEFRGRIVKLSCFLLTGGIFDVGSKCVELAPPRNCSHKFRQQPTLVRRRLMKLESDEFIFQSGVLSKTNEAIELLLTQSYVQQ